MFRHVPYWRFIQIPIATFAISPMTRNAPKQISAVTSGLIAFLLSRSAGCLAAFGDRFPVPARMLALPLLYKPRSISAALPPLALHHTLKSFT